VGKRPLIRVFKGWLNSAGDSINQMIDWGLFATAYMLGQIMSAVMSLYLFDFSDIDLVILPIGLFVTYNTVRFFQKRQDALQETKKLFDDEYERLDPLYEAQFDAGLISASEMTNFISNSIDSGTTTSIGRIWIFRSFDFCMALIILCYSKYSPDDKSFNMRYVMMNTITSGLVCYVGFNTQYVRILHLYAKFCKKVNDLGVDLSSNCVDEGLQTKFRGIRIKRVCIHRGGYTISGLDLNINIQPRTHFVLTGDIGSGKSTIMDALAGKIDGITLFEKTIKDVRDLMFYPSNFFDKIDPKSCSISEIFRTTNPSDFNIIESFMRLLYGNKYAEVSGHFSTFDRQINENLSAGQQQILFLVWILYEVQKKKWPVVLLDEPERNLDKSTMSNVMKALYAHLSSIGVTTILCTHADISTLKQTGIVFTGGHIQIVKNSKNSGTVLFTKP
jgi:ABC-type multidrug transport system fused ATPase/permease subunit